MGVGRGSTAGVGRGSTAGVGRGSTAGVGRGSTAGVGRGSHSVVHMLYNDYKHTHNNIHEVYSTNKFFCEMLNETPSRVRTVARLGYFHKNVYDVWSCDQCDVVKSTQLGQLISA